MNDLSGQSLGRYHLIEKLGEGGMAVVYKAFDTRLECDVAVKVIRMEELPQSGIQSALKRFEREAKAVAQLNHPNIVNVTDYGEQDGLPYLVMKYLPGGTLKQYLGNPMPYPQAARLLEPVARALQYAHSHNVVHRDVKPSNILITESGEPMLTDFGIAKILDLQEGQTLTGTGMGIGTPEYMAPEQWTGNVTPAVDIYSLGVVFYELVTGHKPYTADTPAAVLLKQATEPLPRPTKFVSDLPEKVEQVIFKSLAKNPEDRYTTMSEMITAMQQLQKSGEETSSQVRVEGQTYDTHYEGNTNYTSQVTNVQGTVPPPTYPGYPQPYPPPQINPAQSKRWIGLIVGAAVVVLAGVIVMIIKPWENTSGRIVSNPTDTSQDFYATATINSDIAAIPSETEALITSDPNFQPMSVSAESCDYGGEFRSIEAIDEYTVKFTLCYSDPAFPTKVAFPVFAIQDKDYLDANNGDSIKMSMSPNGTGPYKVVSWNHGDSIVYEANPDYWGTKALTKNLTFRWSTLSSRRLIELQAGAVDGIDDPGPDDIPTIKADSNLKFVERPGFNIFYIGFNNTIAPFDNLDVRKGIALAIDRQRIVDQFYPAGSSVANNFVPDFVHPGASPDVKWYDYDPEAAKAELAKAGYDDANPLEIELSYRVVDRTYLPSPDKVAQEIQAQLAEVGVKVSLKEMESAAFTNATSSGLEGFYLLGWMPDYPDATNFYDYHFGNDANKQFGTLYPDMVAEISAAAKLSDAAARQADYDKINQLLKDNVIMIPVAHSGSTVVYRTYVEGAHTSPLGYENFSVMSNGTDTFVWMQNGEPASLWCSDETDGETLRACEQVYEALLGFSINGTDVVPGLAESYTANADLTEYTFTLRKGVTFHNGAKFDANDVVATFAAQWDAASPNHVGRTGTFEYFGAFFGAFLNAPAE